MGKLIALTGIDGAGKSTCGSYINSLLNENNRRSIIVNPKERKFEFFELLKRSISDGEVAYKSKNPIHDVDPELNSIIMTLNCVYNIHKFILPELSNYDYVISERYTLCYRAFSRALSNERYWVDRICKTVNKPDYILHLDINPKLAMERIHKSRSRLGFKENYSVLCKARMEYNKLLKNESSSFIINTEKSFKEIQSEINDIVSTILGV